MDTSHNKEEDSAQSFSAKLQSLWKRFKESSQFECDKNFIAKVSFFCVFGGLLILNSAFGMLISRSTDVNCVDDKIMTLADSFNAFFVKNVSSRHALVIIGSLCVDLVFVVTVLHWVLFGKSWRLMVTYLMFSIVKVISQALFQLTFPEGYSWDYPGFPSLLVNYHNTYAFFYSSYVGVPVICALEWRKNGHLFFMVVCFAVACFESFTVFVTRVHYTIDIVSAIIFAHYFYILSDKLFAKYVDESCLALDKKPLDITNDKLELQGNSVEQLLV